MQILSQMCREKEKISSLTFKMLSIKVLSFKFETIMNRSGILKDLDLELFTPQLEGWRQSAFTGSAILVALIALLVQRAVFRTINRLGTRYINEIIIPSLVSKVFLKRFQMMSSYPHALHFAYNIFRQRKVL